VANAQYTCYFRLITHHRHKVCFDSSYCIHIFKIISHILCTFNICDVFILYSVAMLYLYACSCMLHKPTILIIAIRTTKYNYMWDFRFPRRVWRWLSSGMLRLVSLRGETSHKTALFSLITVTKAVQIRNGSVDSRKETFLRVPFFIVPRICLYKAGIKQ
jgi:hypothetical protein